MIILKPLVLSKILEREAEKLRNGKDDPAEPKEKTIAIKKGDTRPISENDYEAQIREYIANKIKSIGGGSLGQEKALIYRNAAETLLKEKLELSITSIGGQEKAITEIEKLLVSIREPERYLRWGIRGAKGFLFIGDPGTGKTLSAKVISAEADAAFFVMSLSEVSSAWVGHQELTIKAIFEIAAIPQKSIIFMDEIEALGKSRGSGHSSDSDMLSVILQCIDGIKSKGNITVIGATNKPDLVDSALLSRLSKHIHFEMPDINGRREILDIKAGEAEWIAGRRIFDLNDSDWRFIAKCTEGKSGRDLEEIIRQSLEDKVFAEDTGDTIDLEWILKTAKDHVRYGVDSQAKAKETRELRDLRELTLLREWKKQQDEFEEKIKKNKRPLGFNNN